MENTARNERVSATKEAVIGAARSLFARYGHPKTSVEEIAREAGLSKATVYNYFSGKESIVVGVIEYERKAMVAKLQEAVDGADGPVEKLKSFFLTRIREVQRHHKTYRPDREEIIRHMPQVARAIERNRREERKIIEGVLREGIETGVFRALGDIALTSDILFTTVIGLTFPLFGKPVIRSTEKRVEELVTLFLVGICSDRSRLRIFKEE